MTAFQTAALVTELDTNAKGLPYPASWRTADQDALIVEILNGIVSAGNPTPYVTTLRRDRFTARELTESLDFGEFSVLLDREVQYLGRLNQIQDIDTTKTPVFDALANQIFTNAKAPITRAALLAVLQFQGTRAEELWGEGITVTAGQVGAAANA